GQTVVAIERPRGVGPKQLPAQNPFLNEFPAKYAVALEAARGGAETRYPEYQAKARPAEVEPAREPASRPAAASGHDGEVHVLPVQGNVYMLVGAGGANITMQAGDEGVLLVDASAEALSDRVMKAIRTVSTKPIRYIVN